MERDFLFCPKSSIGYFIACIIVSHFLVINIGCSKSDSMEAESMEEIPIAFSLMVDTDSIAFQDGESNHDVTITTNVDSWGISNGGASWISFSQRSGASGMTTVTITAADNTASEQRFATITINANEVEPITIKVSQEGTGITQTITFPDYNTNPLPPDASGMSSTAVQLAQKITLGWNLGNTLEAIGGETAWGNPKVNKALIDLVKQNGFNAIRIPCSWNQYQSNAAKAAISIEWLDRVKEVIQYCTDNEMYVIINIHWDSGWLEDNVTEEKQLENNARQKAFWEQIATHFRDFDEHLLFASANEPKVEDEIGMAVLNSYHQTFIDAVRSTGGRNAYRTLVVQGPFTDIEKTNVLVDNLPSDSMDDRMMMEVHYYTPWQFCGLTEDADWGNMFYYWGADFHSSTDLTRNATFGEEADLARLFQLMKNQFVDEGIPVVLGEFGAVRRSSLSDDALDRHLASRAYFLKTVVKEARENGILPFYWDNGGNTTVNNAFTLFDRNNNAVFDQQAIDALVEGLSE